MVKKKEKEKFSKTKDNCFYSLCLSALVAKGKKLEVRSMKKIKIRYYVLIALGMVVLTYVASVIINLPWDKRSRASDLTGIDFPLHEIYNTDVSGMGREWGFFVRVFELPDNIKELLDKNMVDLKKQPAYRAGLETDHYTRITWTNNFPRNEVEDNIFSYFRKSEANAASPGLQGIKSDEDAINLDLPPLFVPPLKLEFVFIQIAGA